MWQQSTFVLEQTSHWLTNQDHASCKMFLRWSYELNHEMELFGMVHASDKQHLHKTVILYLSLEATLKVSNCLTWGKLLSKPFMTMFLRDFSISLSNRQVPVTVWIKSSSENVLKISKKRTSILLKAYWNRQMQNK